VFFTLAFPVNTSFNDTISVVKFDLLLGLNYSSKGLILCLIYPNFACAKNNEDVFHFIRVKITSHSLS
jgi:hypothetical protein